MDAYQSDFFRGLPDRVQRKAARAAVAARRPGSEQKGFFTYEGKKYRVVPIYEVNPPAPERPDPAEDRG